MDLVTLADLPDLSGTDPAPTVEIAIGRLDSKLTDPRYGSFAITQADVDGWKRNLSETFGGRVAMDADHSSDRGRGTRAAAWITDISQAGTKNGSLINAKVEFTKWGADLVRGKEYLYTSPTFVANYTDEHGGKHGPALIGAALTNRPVLRKGMPTLSLSQDAFDGVAVPGPDGGSEAKRERKRARKQLARLLSANTAAPRDSRAQMDLSELAKLLDLPADADQVTILAKVAAIKPPEPGKAKEPETVTLDAAAQKKAEKKAAKKARKLAQQNADGTMALSADGYADLLSKANAGQAAALQLSEQTFDHAWQKALDQGRAAPSQEDQMRALFRENQDMAIKTLDSFVQIVPVRPSGSGEGAANGGPTPAGMDDDRFALHTEAKQLAKQLAKDNPAMSPDEVYTMAAIEIDDRRNGTSDGEF
jgi:hypothetical protein